MGFGNTGEQGEDILLRNGHEQVRTLEKFFEKSYLTNKQIMQRLEYSLRMTKRDGKMYVYQTDRKWKGSLIKIENNVMRRELLRDKKVQ